MLVRLWPGRRSDAAPPLTDAAGRRLSAPKGGARYRVPLAGSQRWSSRPVSVAPWPGTAIIPSGGSRYCTQPGRRSGLAQPKLTLAGGRRVPAAHRRPPVGDSRQFALDTQDQAHTLRIVVGVDIEARRGGDSQAEFLEGRLALRRFRERSQEARAWT